MMAKRPISSTKLVKAIYPNAWIGGYIRNWRIYAMHGQERVLAKGTSQYEAWANAARVVLKEQQDATSLPK